MSITRTLVSDKVTAYNDDGSTYTWQSTTVMKLNDNGKISFNCKINATGNPIGNYFYINPVFRVLVGSKTADKVTVSGYKDIDIQSLWYPSGDVSYKKYCASYIAFPDNDNITVKTDTLTISPSDLFKLGTSAVQGTGTTPVGVTVAVNIGNNNIQYTSNSVTATSSPLTNNRVDTFWSAGCNNDPSVYGLGTSWYGVCSTKDWKAYNVYANDLSSTVPNTLDIQNDPLLLPLDTVSESVAKPTLGTEATNKTPTSAVIKFNTNYGKNRVLLISNLYCATGNGVASSYSPNQGKYYYITDATTPEQADAYRVSGNAYYGIQGGNQTLRNYGDTNAKDSKERSYRPTVMWCSTQVGNIKDQDSRTSGQWVRSDAKLVHLPPPKAATNLTAEIVGHRNVKLSWKDQQSALGLSDYQVEIYKGSKAVTVTNGTVVTNGCSQVSGSPLSPYSSPKEGTIPSISLTLSDELEDTGSSIVYSVVYKSSYSAWKGKLKETGDVVADGLYSDVVSVSVTDRLPAGVYVYKNNKWNFAPTIVTKV